MISSRKEAHRFWLQWKVTGSEMAIVKVRLRLQTHVMAIEDTRSLALIRRGAAIIMPFGLQLRWWLGLLGGELKCSATQPRERMLQSARRRDI